MKNACRRTVFVLFISLATSGMLFAQSDLGRISGFVKDPSGATIANAKVTVRNNTGVERQTTTNDSGGRNVVAGPYVYSLIFGMTVADVSGKAIANLATEELSHPAPVFHGDTLFVESEVLETKESRSKPDRGTVKVHTRVLNQDGVLVAEFKRLVLVPRNRLLVRMSMSRHVTEAWKVPRNVQIEKSNASSER